MMPTDLPLPHYQCYKQKFLCRKAACRFHISWLDTGNCVLRIDHEYTRAEIAIVMHISSERVRQIEEKAVGHLLVEIIKKYVKQNPDYTIGEKELIPYLGDKHDEIPNTDEHSSSHNEDGEKIKG